MAVLPKTLSSSFPFTDPQNVALALGFLTLDLSTPAKVTASGQVVPTRVTVPFDSTGKVAGTPSLWANDQLTPTNTLYIANIYNSNGLLVSGPLYWSITGASPIDLSQEIPVSFATLSFSLPGFNEAIFTSTGTFSIPASITKVKVTVIGAGGGGGGSNGANCGTGGGAGGLAIKWLAGLTPGNTLTVTIGAGGTGNSASTGNTGTATTVSSGTQIISTITANSGLGGFGPSTGGNGGGAGGTASGGDLNITGAQAVPPSTVGTVGLDGANTIYGSGGVAIVNAAGTAATGFGSGGGGAQGTGPFAGGTGANGLVIFEWII